MRFLKIALFLVVVFLFLQLFGCMIYNNDRVYYYEELQDALLDVNNQCVGRRKQIIYNDPSVAVTLEEGVATICLLKNIIMDDVVLLKNANLNLNGFSLTNNKTVLIKTYGVCYIYNGYLNRLCENNQVFDGIVVKQSSICHIENVVFESKSSNSTNIAIHVYGEMFLRNSTIKSASFASDENTFTSSVYGNIFSNICIEESDITTESDFGRVEGVYIGDIGQLINSRIVSYANYKSNESRFTSYSVGCKSEGNLSIINCYIYGVHSGINTISSMSIDGGMYCGYGHGGIYCAGIGQTYKIKNAIIAQSEMPAEYEDLGVGCTQGGLYIGGGKNRNNIEVFVDGCTIIATKNPIVLRGSSGEQRNSLYISNTNLDVQHIRVDNNTHRVYLGVGCNFEQQHVDIQDTVVYTNVDYANP